MRVVNAMLFVLLALGTVAKAATNDREQKRLAEVSCESLAQSGRFTKPIVTEIAAVTAFYPAEEYHQDYYKKNPLRYNYYRWGSGRDPFLDRVWGKERGK